MIIFWPIRIETYNSPFSIFSCCSFRINAATQSKSGIILGSFSESLPCFQYCTQFSKRREKCKSVLTRPGLYAGLYYQETISRSCQPLGPSQRRVGSADQDPHSFLRGLKWRLPLPHQLLLASGFSVDWSFPKKSMGLIVKAGVERLSLVMLVM